MLEIIALWALTNRIGNIVKQKGRKSGWYKVLTVVLWFGGEIIGAIFGAIVTGAEESAQCLTYLFALLGAAVGAGIAYLIANSLSPTSPPLPTPPSTPVEAVQSPGVGGDDMVKKGETAMKKRIVLLGAIVAFIGIVLACASVIIVLVALYNFEANPQVSTEQVVVPANGDLILVESRHGRYEYKIRSDGFIDMYMIDDEAVELYEAGQDFPIISSTEHTTLWSTGIQTGQFPPDFALVLVNQGESDATVDIHLSFFPIPNPRGSLPLCGIGSLMLIGGAVAVVVGLLKKTDSRPSEPSGGESQADQQPAT